MEHYNLSIDKIKNDFVRRLMLIAIFLPFTAGCVAFSLGFYVTGFILSIPRQFSNSLNTVVKYWDL